jgi:hypothetical protein
MAKKVESRIVEAVGTAAGGGTGGPNAVELSRRVEQAMVDATLKAMEEGITDSDEIRKRKLEARDRVLAG